MDVNITDSFLVFKNEKKTPGSNQPDYRVIVRDSSGKFVNWGAGWIKDGQSGKYISFQKSKPKPDMKSNYDINNNKDLF